MFNQNEHNLFALLLYHLVDSQEIGLRAIKIHKLNAFKIVSEAKSNLN